MSSKSELVLLLSAIPLTTKEFYNDEEAIANFIKTPFADFLVAVADERVEFPENRPVGYYIKHSTINLLVFVKALSHESLPDTLNSIYTKIYNAKLLGQWTSMPNLLQAKVLASEPEVRVNEKVTLIKIPVIISEIIQ